MGQLVLLWCALVVDGDLDAWPVSAHCLDFVLVAGIPVGRYGNGLIGFIIFIKQHLVNVRLQIWVGKVENHAALR